jgi:hypothetical protein
MLPKAPKKDRKPLVVDGRPKERGIRQPCKGF